MDDLETQLAGLLASFTTKVAALVNRAAVDAASAAFGSHGRRASTAPRKPVRAPRRAPPARTATADVAAAAAQVVSYLLHKPGLRGDQLSEALKLPTSDLKPVVRKLVADRMLRAEGNTRGRRYFAAKGATSATSSRTKAAKRKKRRSKR